jgi:hypothetical protein
MPSWDDDEWWDDRDEPVRHARPPVEGQEPEPPAVPVPLEPELEGAIYLISDTLSGVRAVNRDRHPCLCVRCDLRARVALMSLGRDAASPWAGVGTTVPADPTPGNGLTKRTAFTPTPWPMRLPVLRLIHAEEGPMGRLEADLLALIRALIERLSRGHPGVRR